MKMLTSKLQGLLPQAPTPLPELVEGAFLGLDSVRVSSPRKRSDAEDVALFTMTCDMKFVGAALQGSARV